MHLSLLLKEESEQGFPSVERQTRYAVRSKIRVRVLRRRISKNYSNSSQHFRITKRKMSVESDWDYAFARL